MGINVGKLVNDAIKESPVLSIKQARILRRLLIKTGMESLIFLISRLYRIEFRQIKRKPGAKLILIN